MTKYATERATPIGLGAAAGFAGAAVMMAMRTFDGKYAPATVARASEDPGQFMVRTAERVVGSMPKSIEQPAAMAVHTSYGTFFGILYGLLRGRSHNRSALGEGIFLGTAVYAAGHLGWLPAIGLTKPVWKENFPEIAGELLRHVAYGVAVTATFSALQNLLQRTGRFSDQSPPPHASNRTSP